MGQHRVVFAFCFSLLLVGACNRLSLGGGQGERFDGSIGTWNVGFNELFVQEVLMFRGISCDGCSLSTNSMPVNPNTMTSVLKGLAESAHVGTYREIVPIALVEPKRGDHSNYEEIRKVLNAYQGFNLNLVLAFGAPLPKWMAKNGWCFMPAGDGDYERLKNEMATAIGELLHHLWANGNGEFRTWMKDRMHVEGWNEFDGLSDGDCRGRTLGTPARAAALTNGIITVADRLGVPRLQMVSPSVVGVYEGYHGLVGAGNAVMAQWLADYYTAGGNGLPSAHIYVQPGSPSAMLDEMVARVHAINLAMPAIFKNRLVVGELGIGAGPCKGGMGAGDRDLVYAGFAKRAAPEVELITYWRLFQLEPSKALPADNCENWYGALSMDGTRSNVPALFRFLQSGN